MWTMNFQMFKLYLEEAEEPEIKLPTSVGSLKKQKCSRKTSTSLTMPTDYAFDCVDHNKLWKILKWMGIPGHLTSLLRNLYSDEEATVRIGHSKWTGSRSRREYAKTIYCHLAHLTYMQNMSCKMPDWIKHKLESRLQGEISITSDMQMTAP